MPTLHKLYGLTLASDEPIPGLLEVTDFTRPDIHVHFRAWPGVAVDVASLEAWPPGFDKERTFELWRCRSRGFFLFRFPDDTEFVVDEAAENIWSRWVPPFTIADAATYFVSAVVGFALRRRGRVCLHASCTSIDGAAIALIGVPQAGKSTTASAFALRGYSVLTDDLTPLIERGGQFMAVPGYPRLCLWPASAEALFGEADMLPLITPNWTKRYHSLHAGSGSFEREPTPLAALYFLAPRSVETTAPRIEPLNAGRALMRLVANTHGNLRMDSEMRAREFVVLERLVQSVPARIAVPHAAFGRIGELCDAIIQDLSRLCSAAA